MPDGWGSQWRGGESEEGEGGRGRVVKEAIGNDPHGDAPPLKLTVSTEEEEFRSRWRELEAAVVVGENVGK